MAHCQTCKNQTYDGCSAIEPGWYGDAEVKDIRQCMTDCISCTGPSFIDCKTCKTGYELNSTEQACVESVINITCIENCQNCTDSTFAGCTQCNDGYYLNSTDQKCNKCTYPCKICKGYLSGDCSSCQSDGTNLPMLLKTAKSDGYGICSSTKQCD